MNEKWVADEIMALKQGGGGKHASTHSNSGEDRVTLDSSQITSGTLDAARIPIASAGSRGAVKVGSGLNVASDGTISTTGSTASWGNITGTLSNQTDLNNALNGKAASSHNHSASEITSGTMSTSRLPTASTSSFGIVKIGSGITVSGGVISASGGSPFLSIDMSSYSGLQSAVNYGISKGATTLYLEGGTTYYTDNEGLKLSNVSGPAMTIYFHSKSYSSNKEINLNGNITLIITADVYTNYGAYNAESCIVLNNGAKMVSNSNGSISSVTPWGTGYGMNIDNCSEFICDDAMQYQGGANSRGIIVNRSSTFRCGGKINYLSGETYTLTLTNCSFAIVGTLGNSNTKVSHDTSSIVFVNGTKQA